MIGEDGLTRGDADKLLAVARTSPLGGNDGTRILIDGGRYVRAQNVVGVIAADDCAIEILPKIDGISDDAGVRHLLVHMLAVAYELDIAPGAATGLALQRETLLEILIRLFADQIIEAVRRGLPHRYIEQSEDLASLRGRLDVTRQFTILAADPGRLASHYDKLSPDTPLNRIVKAAVDRLRRLARHPETQRRLGELAFAYGEVTSVPRSRLPWERLQLDRTDRRWRPIIDMARLLLGDRFQTTSTGDTSGTALLFDMGKLFESYVARCLRAALAGTAFNVVVQGGLRYCLTELGEDERAGTERFQTRPDILIKSGAEVRMVVDTKWKRISHHTDDGKRGVGQADIYQMMAYARLYRSPHLMLLYPHHAGRQADSGIVARYAIQAGQEKLTTATVDLATAVPIKTQLHGLVAAILGPSLDGHSLGQ